MPYQNNDDNIYPVGTIIRATEAPTVRLEIRKYLQRIYYCVVPGDQSGAQKAYFERELIPPGTQS